MISANTSMSLPQLQDVPDSVTINTPVTFGYQTVPGLDLSGRTRVEFSVQEETDAHVMLTMRSGGVFELVIGGWGNSRTVVRRARAGADIVSANGAVLSRTEFRTFVLDWSTPRVLKLFSKSSSGALTEILATPQQPESVLDVTTMAVSSFTCPGIFKIQVSARSRSRRLLSLPPHSALPCAHTLRPSARCTSSHCIGGAEEAELSAALYSCGWPTDGRCS